MGKDIVQNRSHRQVKTSYLFTNRLFMIKYQTSASQAPFNKKWNIFSTFFFISALYFSNLSCCDNGLKCKMSLDVHEVIILTTIPHYKRYYYFLVIVERGAAKTVWCYQRYQQENFYESLDLDTHLFVKVTSTRKGQKDLCCLRVKLPPVTTSLKSFGSDSTRESNPGVYWI